MGPKSNQSKKQKSNHNRTDREKGKSFETASNSSCDTNELPGFYFDPVKNRYFKIQQNTFGVHNVPTKEIIKIKLENEELKKKCNNQLIKRSLIAYLLKKEIYGADNSLRLDLTDNLIIKSKLKSLCFLDSNSPIKKIEVLPSQLFLDRKNFIYILINFVGVPFIYKVFELCTDIFQNEEKLSRSQCLKKLSFIDQNENGIVTGPIDHMVSNLPAFMASQNHILSTYQSVDHNDNRPYKLKISKIDIYGHDSDLLVQIPKYYKSYKFPLWCSDVNKEITRCAVGLHQGAEVNNLGDNHFFRLNTYRSDVFCIKLKPESDLVYAGCKSKLLFGYDLRCRVNNPICEMKHESCVNDLIFCPKNSNYLFVNDFTGEINLWDVRHPIHSVVKFSDGQNCNSRCSIKLNSSGDYLYLMPKDGHIRVFNTVTTNLIKTIISAEDKDPNQLYSEIPSIHIFDDLSMLYGIDHKLMYYSI